MAPGCCVLVATCTLAGACSLQDTSHLRDESLFAPDGGSINAPGAGGVTAAGSGQGGTAGGSGNAGQGSSSGSSGAGSSVGSGGAGGTPGSAGAVGTGDGGTGGVGAAAGAAGTPGDAGADPSLVSDPGFESGVAGWVALGSVTITWEVESPHAGTHCLRASSRGNDWAGPSYSLRDVITPGASYRVSAWMRTADADQVIKVTAKTVCSGDSSGTYTEVVSLSTAQDSWQSYTGQFVAPTCALDEFRLYVEGPPAAEDIFLDDFRVEEAPP